ncbi:UvrD-helicase domain-containing protein [Streptomyces albipurpureus]|uniref:AAA family ATPase n=1 Tax=Streptomyces albipurpureus TaxID=2897419 RepID=A0ABT0UJF6_9ACTN|nr:UvrD-helicase domain-containing protein [Streptomyces sp. CWNU-1]MCM2388768.1 AAA family ATPase [Streptomyces sp. CWNU-1]
MYQTPRQLSALDAQAATDLLHFYAATSPDLGWQYRLYVIGHDSPETGADEAGRFLLVRVEEDGSVHEVASPQTLPHQQWAENLLDRLWETMETGSLLEGEAQGPTALASAEQRLVAGVINGPAPEGPTVLRGGTTGAPAEDGSADLWEDAPTRVSDYSVGDEVEHQDEREDEPVAAVVVGFPGPREFGDLLVQDVDLDDEPYPVLLHQIVSRQRPPAKPEHEKVQFRPQSQDDLAPSGPVARIRANIAAIRTLHTLREEQRPASGDEQRVLARWSSWGAVPNIFHPGKPEFATLRAELRPLLSEEEWYAAEATTRNAHFTDASLVQPIWQALTDLGFRDGRVLEPGCGSGNFIAYAPETARMTGVELDPVTAEIAAALYPDADIRSQSFVDTRVPEGYFDAAVGNVPFDEIAITDPLHNPLRLATHNHFIVKALELTRPGGLVAVLTSRYTLDSTGKTARLEIADRADLIGAVRLPAGAHRRAAGTNTVTDILILRRRDGGAPETPPAWIGLSSVQVGPEQTALVNSYFAQHPEMVLGTIGLTSTQFGRDDVTVRPTPDTDLSEALSQALSQITRQARETGMTMSASPDAVQRAAVEERAERMRRAQEMFGEELQRFEGTILDQREGTFLQVVGGELNERPVFKNSVEELRSLLRLRDTYVNLLSAESTANDGEAAQLRGELNGNYNSHIARYGFLNKRDSRRDRRSAHGTFRSDPYAAGVYALERYDKDAGTARKSAIFSRAVTKPTMEEAQADSPQDALAISLNTHGEVQLNEIARLLGLESLDDARDALGDTVFNEPGTQRLVPAAEYLSGNVREKLEKAEQILRMVSDESRSQHPFQANVAALRQTLQTHAPDKQPGDIEDINFGATWIAPTYYQQFLRQLLQSRAVTVSRTSGADWNVEASSSVRKSRVATKIYGTARRNAVDLAQRLLRRSSLVVHPPKLDKDATPEEIQDGKRWAAEQTEQVIAKTDELNRLLADWLWQDPARTKDVLTTYNRLHNSYVPYQGDGSHLTFPGLSDEITPRPHQRAGVARALSEPGGSFFDYEVGFGKTLTIAMTLMEMKRLGTVRKPCVVVKNATVNDFRNDFLKAYPQARVLAIDSSEFTRETAASYIAQIANGDWDAVILPQSLFNRIPVSGRGQAQFVADQTAEHRARIHKALTGDNQALSPLLNPGDAPLIADALDTVAAMSAGQRLDRSSRETVKSLQGDLKRHTQRAEKNLVKETIAGISWEQTGIDFIAVDEVQDYANGEVGANNTEISLPVSAQAKGLKVKLRLAAKAYGPKVGLGSTGTPFPNAMPQAYVMLDYFRPDLLEAAEISAFSSFQAQFLREVVAPEISPEGTPRMKERIGAFRNAKQFHPMWKSMADVKTKHDIQLPVPKHVSDTIVVPATEQDRLYMADIADRADLVRTRMVDPTVDNLLSIANDGRKAAMDLRMVGIAPDGPGKLDAIVDKVFEIWLQYKDETYTDREGNPSDETGALQLVFADRGTPSDNARKKGRFIAYDYMRDKLIERGMPAELIGYAQDAKSAEEKESLWSASRRGRYAVLIGSTETMGVGVNAQDRAIALHHVDCPWRPSDVTQREGRIVRQYNQHFHKGIPVRIFRWVKAGSFDSFMWQTVERKAKFIDQVRTGREIEEQEQALDGDLGKDYLEFGEIKAIATGNPVLLKKMQADEEVRQLDAAFKNWKRTQTHLRNVVDTGDQTLSEAQSRADLVQKAVQVRTETKGEAFRMELPNGNIITRRQQAAIALRTELALIHRQMRGEASGWQHVATLGGQRFEARINSFHDSLDFSIRGLRDIPQASFTVDDVAAIVSDGKPPLGLVTRLENQAEKLPGLHSTMVAVVAELSQEIDRARKLVDHPFSKMDKLRRARAEQAQLEAEIESQASGSALHDEDSDVEDSASSPAAWPGIPSVLEIITAFQEWDSGAPFAAWRKEAGAAEDSPESAQRRRVHETGAVLVEEVKRQRTLALSGGAADGSVLRQAQELADAATSYLDILETKEGDPHHEGARALTHSLITTAATHLDTMAAWIQEGEERKARAIDQIANGVTPEAEDFEDGMSSQDMALHDAAFMARELGGTAVVFEGGQWAGTATGSAPSNPDRGASLALPLEGREVVFVPDDALPDFSILPDPPITDAEVFAELADRAQSAYRVWGLTRTARSQLEDELRGLHRVDGAEANPVAALHEAYFHALRYRGDEMEELTRRYGNVIAQSRALAESFAESSLEEDRLDVDALSRVADLTYKLITNLLASRTANNTRQRQPATPYADREEFWLTERAVQAEYSDWEERRARNLGEGVLAERALVTAAERAFASSVETRRSRLLGFDDFPDAALFEEFADAVREVADQWDREQRASKIVSSTWTMYRAVRNHAERYRDTVESADLIQQWAATSEPITPADPEVPERVPALSPGEMYTVTGPDGRRSEPRTGADLAARIAQLAAEGDNIEESQLGLTLSTVNGTRFEISVIPRDDSVDFPSHIPTEQTSVDHTLRETSTVSDMSPSASEIEGTAIPRARSLAILLGAYGDSGELVAGRELIQGAILQVQAILQTRDDESTDQITEVLSASTALTDSEQITPGETFALYDRLAASATALAEATDGELAAQAAALAQRTERHLGRMHANSRDLFDMLLDRLDPDSWAVLARTDPLKERPSAYSDSSHLAFARSRVFETYDRWPQVYSSAGGEASDQLRGAMWQLRQAPDTAIGSALPDWMQAVTHALRAAEEAAEGVSRSVLREVARQAYEHHRTLAAPDLAAVHARPFQDSEQYIDGAAQVASAWGAWMETQTGHYLTERTGRDGGADGTSSSARAALDEVGHALHSAEWATVDDETLDDITRRTTKLAHTTYALVMSLSEGGYRHTDDKKALDRLVRVCYEHAASCRASAQQPTAIPAVRQGVAQRQDQLRAELGPDASVPPAGARRDRTTADDRTLEVEHHYRGTVVRGITDEEIDGRVRAALDRHGFKPSSDRAFWYLPRRMTQINRDGRVRKLIDDLGRLRRPYEMANEPSEQTGKATTIPVGEPYATRAEAEADFQEMFGAYWQIGETPAGKRLISRGQGARPDGEAVHHALEDLRQGAVAGNRDPFIHAPEDVADRCATLARTLQTLSRHLDEERYRAPVALRHLRTMSQYATLLASRITATAAAGTWRELFPAPDTTSVTSSPVNSQPENPTSLEETAEPPAPHLDPLVSGPYRAAEMAEAVGALQLLLQQASEALPSGPQPEGPFGPPSGGLEEWHRGPARIKLPDGFVPYESDIAVLKPGDVIRERFKRWLESPSWSYRTLAITHPRDGYDGYYRAAPGTRVHPREIVAVPSDSRHLTGADEDQYTARHAFAARWEAAGQIAGAALSGEESLIAAIDAYRQAFTATGAFVSELEHAHLPDAGRSLVSQLLAKTEHHLVRLTLTLRVDEESAEREQQHREEEREAARDDQGNVDDEGEATDRARKRAEVEARIAASLARTHDRARKLAVETALEDETVRSWFSESKPQDKLRPLLRDWLRAATIGDGPFRDWFIASGPGAEETVAQLVADDVYTRMTRRPGPSADEVERVEAEPEWVSSAEVTAPAEVDLDPPGKAGQIAENARANGWQVSGVWSRHSKDSNPSYALTLKARTARGNRDFRLTWEMSKGRHAYNSQKSCAFHHADKSAKRGFRPKLADVEAEVRFPAVEEVAAPPQPGAPAPTPPPEPTVADTGVEQPTLFDPVQHEPAEAREFPAAGKPPPPGNDDSSRLTSEHLDTLPAHIPRRQDEDARLAVVATLAFSNGQARDTLLLLQSIELGPETDDLPVVRGAQIVPAGSPVSTSLNGRYLPADLLAMADTHILPLTTPVPWATVEGLARLAPHEARQTLTLGTPETAATERRFSGTGQLRTHFKAAPIPHLSDDLQSRRLLERLAAHESFELTPNGQFAMVQDTPGSFQSKKGATWSLFAAGSGFQAGRVDEYAYLMDSGLETALDVMGSLHSRAEALALSEHLVAIQSHRGSPVDWSDPALPETLGAFASQLDREVLRARAAFEHERGRSSETSGILLVWNLMAPQPDRNPSAEGEAYVDELEAGDRIWFGADDEYLPREVLDVRDGPAGLVTLRLAALLGNEEDGTISLDEAYEWDAPRNLPVSRATQADVKAETGFPLSLSPSTEVEPDAHEEGNRPTSEAVEREPVGNAPVPAAAAPEEELTRSPAQQTAPESMPEDEQQEEHEEETVAVTDSDPEAGSWSSRIRIVQEGGSTFVTGTGGDHWQQEGELRELLKKNRNFAFREGRWRYQGGGGNRERVLDEVRGYLRAKDAQEAKAVATASVTEYPPTSQQQRIIDACLAGQDVAVQALAGTGKTSTLQMVTRRMPDKRIAYVAFNRSIADEAKRKFPQNVTADTSHSFARAGLRNTRLKDKISKAGRNGGARRPKDVAAALGLTRPVRFTGGGVEPQDAARIVMLALRRYRESADAELGPQHLGDKWSESPAAPALLDIAHRAWADITDPNSNRLFFSHDDYLKLWALTNPRLNYDLILFDEAQDINPVLEKVIQDQPTQTIVVGDSNQAIYEFRGAIDALKDWPADVVLPLTQSWRFGPEAAAVGNAYLKLLGSDLALDGNPDLDTTLGTVTDPDAVLTKTNIAAIGAVITGFEEGKRVALVGGGRDIEEVAKAARDLQRGQRTKHPELAAFTSWNEVREYAEEEDDQALQTLVRLVDRYTPEGLLNMIRDLVPEESKDEETRPDLVVSTAHKAKGREWDQVRIGPDFTQPTENTETGELTLPSPAELRLAYVTVTRAKQRLEIGSLGWIHTIDEETMQAPIAVAVAPTPAPAAADVRTQLEPAPQTTTEQQPNVADSRQTEDPTAGEDTPLRTGRPPHVSISLRTSDQGTLVASVEIDEVGTAHVLETPLSALKDQPLPITVELPLLARAQAVPNPLVRDDEVRDWLGEYLPSTALGAAWEVIPLRNELTRLARDVLRDSMAPSQEEVAGWLVDTAAEHEGLVQTAHHSDLDGFATAFAEIADGLVTDSAPEHLLWVYFRFEGAYRSSILHLATPEAHQRLRSLDLPSSTPPEQATRTELPVSEMTEEVTAELHLPNGGSRAATRDEIVQFFEGMETADGTSVLDIYNETHRPSHDEAADAPQTTTIPSPNTGSATSGGEQSPTTAVPTPLPWDTDKIRKRAAAGIRRGQDGAIRNLARDVSEAVGSSRARVVWEQDNPFAQFEANLQHTLDSFSADDAPSRDFLLEVAGELHASIEQIAARAGEHYNSLITPNAGDPRLLAALDEQLTAENRLPELSNPFVREALILVLTTIDEAERTARGRKLKPAAVRDALDQIVGLAGSSSGGPNAELFPHIDAALTPVKVQLDAAREVMAELGLNATVLDEYTRLRTLIANHRENTRPTETVLPQTETESPEPPAPPPLADRDIALALSLAPYWQFGQMIFDIDNGVKRYPDVHGTHIRVPAGPGNEEGQERARVHSSRAGLEISVSAGEAVLRSGRITWAKALTWLRPALTPLRQELVSATWRTDNALSRSEDAFTAIGESGRFRAAGREVHHLLQSLKSTIIQDSVQAHESGQAAGMLARNQARAQGTEEGLISLDDLVDPSGGQDRTAEQDALERVRQLRALLPDRHTGTKPLRDVGPGDAFWQVSHQRLVFVADGGAIMQGSQIAIPGTIYLGGGETRPYTWAVDSWESLDTQVQHLMLPQSLASLIDLPPDRSAAALPASPAGATAETAETDTAASLTQESTTTDSTSTHNESAGVETSLTTEEAAPGILPHSAANTQRQEESGAHTTPKEREPAAGGEAVPEPAENTTAQPYPDRYSYLQDSVELRRTYEAWAHSSTARTMLAEEQELRQETGVSGATEAGQIEEGWRAVYQAAMRANRDWHALAESHSAFVSTASQAGRALDQREAFVSVDDRRLLHALVTQARAHSERLDATVNAQQSPPPQSAAIVAPTLPVADALNAEESAVVKEPRPSELASQSDDLAAEADWLTDDTGSWQDVIDTTAPRRDVQRAPDQQPVTPTSSRPSEVEHPGSFSSGPTPRDAPGHPGTTVSLGAVPTAPHALPDTSGLEEPVAQTQSDPEDLAISGTSHADDLERHFQSMLSLFQESPVSDTAGEVPRFSAEDAQRLAERYTILREQLSLILTDVGGQPMIARTENAAVDTADAAALDAAVGAAQSEAGYYWGSPEWESIRQVRQAALGLRAAVREALGTYAESLVRDIRAQGLDRTIQAWTARAVSHAAFALARRLDRGGQRDSGGWRAMWRLHRAAVTRADRLTGLLPAGQEVGRADQLRGAWRWLAARINTRSEESTTPREPGRAQSLIANGYETIKRYYQLAADRIGDLAQHPVWRRLTSVFKSSREVLDRTWAGTHRLHADNETLGTGRMLWVRTVEVIAHGIRTLLDRLARGGNREGLRYNVLRALHHAAEDHLSHLRGYLPEDATTPLGTYSDPAPATTHLQDITSEPGNVAELAERPELATADTGQEWLPSANGDWEQLLRAAEVVTESNYASPVALQLRLQVGHQESGDLLRRLEELKIVGAPARGSLRKVLRSPGEVARIIGAARAAQEPQNQWRPRHNPFRSTWFDEVRAALPREPQPQGALSRSDMISLLFRENQRVTQHETDQEGAGQRANHAVELYLSGRGNEVPAMLAGEGFSYAPDIEGKHWEAKATVDSSYRTVGRGNALDPAPSGETTPAQGSERVAQLPLPQRRRTPSESPAPPASPHSPQAQPSFAAAPGRPTNPKRELAIQAYRLGSKAQFAAATATTPAEQKKAENLLQLAEKSRVASEKLSNPSPSATPGTDALMAEPFLAALRAHATAQGAALPEDVVQSAWTAAAKATGSVQRPGSPPAGESPTKADKGRPDRHAQQQVHHQQSSSPNAPGRR